MRGILILLIKRSTAHRLSLSLNLMISEDRATKPPTKPPTTEPTTTPTTTEKEIIILEGIGAQLPRLLWGPSC